MRLKNIPNWLRGAVLADFAFVVFAILVLAIYKPFFDFCGHMGCGSDWLMIIGTFPASKIILPTIDYITSLVILGIVQYFIIGAIIGLVVSGVSNCCPNKEKAVRKKKKR